jgi:hypothetical protein
MNSVAKPLNIADFRWARRRLPAALGKAASSSSA